MSQCRFGAFAVLGPTKSPLDDYQFALKGNLYHFEAMLTALPDITIAIRHRHATMEAISP